MTLKTQALFVQDFPPKDAASPPSSPFEAALADYLAAYGLRPSEAALARRLVAAPDFIRARAARVSSVPGHHRGARALARYGHTRLRALLAAEPMPAAWRELPAALQFSSLGKLTKEWLMDEFVPSLTAGAYAAGGAEQQQHGDDGGGGGGSKQRRQTSLDGYFQRSPGKRAGGDPAKPPPGAPLPPEKVHIVWPTLDDVRNSLEGWRAGGSIPGSWSNVAGPDRAFLGKLWRRWDGAPAGRARAAPHVKTFCRFDPASRRLAWLLVTSHNLSKAAWGQLQLKGEQLRILSYELGALLLPRLEAAYRAHRHRGFSVLGGGGGGSSDGGSGPSAGAAPRRQVAFYAARQAVLPAARGGGQQEQGDADALMLPLPYALPPAPYAPPGAQEATTAANAGRRPWVWDADAAYYGGLPDVFGQLYQP